MRTLKGQTPAATTTADSAPPAATICRTNGRFRRTCVSPHRDGAVYNIAPSAQPPSPVMAGRCIRPSPSYSQSCRT
ncbi:hypothetical protein OF001_U20347 [Pseudomonas sp. OF001]|nr:hypothetical protein OF001_U20347 [Pseudomonas sp. OF001]